MQAIVLNSFGGIDNLVARDIPVPDIAADEVLIRSVSISVNPVDIKTRKGRGMAEALKKDNPMILGWDVSGIIEKKGNNVSGFREGDEVFGMVNFPGTGKTYAGYVAAPASSVTLKPDVISHNEAAAACLAALTAWQIFKEKAILKRGDRILIHAAAGGVGHFAVQMAKYLGAEVAGTASARNREFVKSLGADTFIDYEAIPFENVLNSIDYVLDCIGRDYIDRSLKVLKKGGILVSIPSDANETLEEKALSRGMKGAHFHVHSDGNDMKEIAELLRTGAVKSHISEVFGFNDMRKAHLQIESGRTRGKIVLTL